MGLSLGDKLPKLKLPLMIYLSHTTTDETFGVNISKSKDDDILNPKDVLGTNVIAHLTWTLATFFGALFGEEIIVDMQIVKATLPIMFAVLLGMQLKNRVDLLIVLLSVLLTMFFMQVMTGSWPFICTALIVPSIIIIYDITNKDKALN